MKIEVTLNGEKKEIEIKGLRGRDIKKIINNQMKIQDIENEKEKISQAKLCMDLLDEICSRISGLTVEQLNEIDIEDKEKISDYVSTKARNTLGL